jgi:PAS domain S-box-containing protein
MIGLPLAPTIMVDIVGSALVIILSFISLCYAYFLTKLQQNNFLYGFLFYFCIALTAFALSRGVGHIVRQLLILIDQAVIWKTLSPYSGGFNTLLLSAAAAVTIYYHKGLDAYHAVRNEAEKLADTNTKLADTTKEVQRINLHLEEMAEVRAHKLLMTEKKFRHFFENSKDMVYFCGRGGLISDINDSGLSMLGYTYRPENCHFHSFFKDDDALEEYLIQLHENGFVKDFEVEMKKRDGSVCHVLLTTNAIRNEEGQMIGCEGIGKDMTHLRTMTEQLINQKKMASVGQLAAGVAHEINTPLGIALGYVQHMKDDYPEEIEKKQSLVIVERQINTCRKIIADLMKFSRQSYSEKTDFNINEVIEDIISATGHSLEMDHIEVDRDLAQDLPTIPGDPEKLRQAFFNLINNAHQAMSDGGRISIKTSPSMDKKKVICSVSDTGPGIKENIIDKIFDPFFTTKEVGKGAGLGLSVTYGIIAHHDGEITVESPGHNGVGATFHIKLPTATLSAMYC